MTNFSKIILVFILLSQASCHWFKKEPTPEVLDAFKLVSNGMQASNEAIDNKNNSVMKALHVKWESDSVKYDSVYKDALYAMKLSDEFTAYVDALREYLISESGGYESDSTFKGKRNFEVTTRIMIDEGRGGELKRKIEELREALLSLSSLDSLDRDILATQFTLSTEYNIQAAKRLGKKSWASYLFDHVPVIAANTILQKTKGNAKSSAGLVIERLIIKAERQDERTP